MPSNEINYEMRQHALAAAEMVRAEYGHELDFSEATIGAVEAILNGFWQEGEPADEFFLKVALLFGSYIGEVIRESFPDAAWAESVPDSETSEPSIKLADIEVFPLTWCYKRLVNGPDDSVVKKYLEFRKEIDSRA